MGLLPRHRRLYHQRWHHVNIQHYRFWHFRHCFRHFCYCLSRQLYCFAIPPPWQFHPKTFFCPPRKSYPPNAFTAAADNQLAGISFNVISERTSTPPIFCEFVIFSLPLAVGDLWVIECNRFIGLTKKIGGVFHQCDMDRIYPRYVPLCAVSVFSLSFPSSSHD